MGKEIKLIHSNAQIHRCNICGNIGEWSDTWSWCFHFPKVRRGEFQHEETIKFCSTDCQEKYNKSKIKELASTRNVDLKHNK